MLLIRKKSMVGNKLWERGMCLFCEPFTTAQIHYFDEYEAGKAEAWSHAESNKDETKERSQNQH